MNRCKCLEALRTSEGNSEFLPDNFYNFDYVPAAGQNAPFYRVFYNEKKAESINFNVFRKFFKKY